MNIAVPVTVQVDSLRKQYGDLTAVDCVSFEVERGSVFGMIGPNGAGKTTTIACLEELRRQDGMCAQPKGRWIQGQIVGASRLLRPSGWAFRTLKRAPARE